MTLLHNGWAFQNHISIRYNGLGQRHAPAKRRDETFGQAWEVGGMCRLQNVC
ncbi:MAG: hypothetical protein JNM78_13260 [Cyclobacteriaceae bacterium]|nr:hypothetical protein [Cyclobacteriaceae bacterium]